MNPGAVEEAGKAASTTIEALKSTPVVLALVIFNVLYMAGGFWTQVQQSTLYDKAADRWKDMAVQAMKFCPTGTQGMKLQSDESAPYELPPLPTPKPDEAKE